jgi:hypothetical protein
MAQHDYVIDNQAFPATRADLNSVLQAIVTNNSGSSAPSTTFANQIWYDSSANILYIRNEDNDANIPLLQLDQSGDVAATLATIIDVLDKSGTNTAGTDLTIRAGAGTGTGAGGKIILQTADGGSSGSSVNSHATAVTIADDGNVGVGLTDPDTPLEVQIGSSGNALKLSSSTDGASVFLAFEQQESGTKHVRGRIRAASSGVEGGLIFETGASSSTSERMRIDNSGRLLVGKTTSAIGTAGHTLQADGFFSATRSASQCAGFNRLSDDGNVVEIRKDGTLAGSIGARYNTTYYAGASGQSGVLFNSNGTIPTNSSGSVADNTYDLGQTSARWDDIHATNSTIQTSDQNEKQDIASLTDTEITAAKAISKLFKTFKWKDKVTSKGDNARTHSGVIAQEVQQAMTDAGLDATKYAFFCSDTWWETQTEVPAVEADEENGIEAKDAYTRTDTYDTADEAPEGATERTRLGIRYPELLAFVGAATEQRLASIEARLTALEG